MTTLFLGRGHQNRVSPFAPWRREPTLFARKKKRTQVQGTNKLALAIRISHEEKLAVGNRTEPWQSCGNAWLGAGKVS